METNPVGNQRCREGTALHGYYELHSGEDDESNKRSAYALYQGCGLVVRNVHFLYWVV